jgi:hypothetical protein
MEQPDDDVSEVSTETYQEVLQGIADSYGVPVHVVERTVSAWEKIRTRTLKKGAEAGGLLPGKGRASAGSSKDKGDWVPAHD